MARNEKVGHLIESTVGVVEEVDLLVGEIAWGEFMRVRVCLDVTKPLLRGKKLRIGSSTPYWVRFSYERLPDFCYICGKLGHSHHDCEHLSSFDEKSGSFPYGQWLR